MRGIICTGGHGFVVVPVDISFQTVGVLFFSPAGEALVTSVAGVFLLLGSSASAYRRRVVGCASPQSAIFAPVITL